MRNTYNDEVTIRVLVGVVKIHAEEARDNRDDGNSKSGRREK